jgi:hypothetical protein
MEPESIKPSLPKDDPFFAKPITVGTAKPATPEKKELEHFVSPVGPKPLETVGQKEPVIRTLKADSEALIKSGITTVISSAAAAARRRAREGSYLHDEATSPRWLRILGIIGVLLLLVGGGLLMYVSLKPTNTIVPITASRPIDATRTISIDITRKNDLSLRTLFLKQVGDLEGKLGSVVAVDFSKDTSKTAITTREFFTTFNFRAPDAFTRALDPAYMLGVHIFDGNQPFLIFKTDYFEQAFAGMLAWEPTLAEDVGTLLRSKNDFLNGSTTEVSFLSQFSDEVIKNHDARVLRNNKGDVLLLYTFPDRGTLLITTSSKSMSELIDRLNAITAVPTR